MTKMRAFVELNPNTTGNQLRFAFFKRKQTDEKCEE
jgi:hypothetical protein